MTEKESIKESSKNKTIAKNTAFLYIRMIFLMLISLYTSRVVLKNLGIENYGIYNLVGGIVVFFTFIGASLSAATKRYISYSLGQNDSDKVKRVISSSIIISFFVSLITIALAETIGLYIVYNYIVIPSERMKAALVVYQFSIFTTVISIIKIPYGATIECHEEFSFYAILSIFEAVAKFAIAFFLLYLGGDVLIVYGFLLAVSSLVFFLIYKVYCNVKYPVSRFKWHKDKILYKEMFSFSLWNLLSSFCSLLALQGKNIILNRFFGVAINAAVGIANQVNSAVYSFVSNFQLAFEPQIVKSYADGNKNYLTDLIFKTSKFSFYLLWFIVLALSVNADIVLRVWLDEVPEYSTILLRLVLIDSLINALNGPLGFVAFAIGDIRNYQIIASVMDVLSIPLVYLCFKMGLPPYTVMAVNIVRNVIYTVYRYFYLTKRMEFSVLDYTKRILLPCAAVCVISLVVTYMIFNFMSFNVVVQFFVSCTVSVIVNALAMYFIGCNKSERQFVLTAVNKVLKRNK